LLQPSLHGLSARDRRRLIATTVLRTAATVALILVGYALAPAEPVTGVDAYFRLAIVLAIIAVVVVLQIQAILSANVPEVRALEAVIVAVALFVALFALFYLGLSKADPANFNEPLDRVSAMYFTVTVLATVGFGDISPRTDTARLVVTAQMLLDLALIAIVVRVFFSAARRSRSK